MIYKLIVFCILISQFLTAQSLRNSDIYIKTGGSAGNYLGAKIALEYIYHHDYTFTLGSCFQGSIYKKLPDDYISPDGILSIFNLLRDYPRENLTTYYFSFGKIMKTHTDKIRFNLSGGLGCARLWHPADFNKIVPAGNAENYTYNYKKDYSVALVLNPSVDFAVWKYFGLSTGLMAIITPDRFSLGLETTYMIGNVRHDDLKKMKTGGK